MLQIATQGTLEMVTKCTFHCQNSLLVVDVPHNYSTFQIATDIIISHMLQLIVNRHRQFTAHKS